MKTWDRFRWEFEGFLFFGRNFWASRSIPAIEAQRVDGFTFCGVYGHLMPSFVGLHELMRGGRSINFWRRLLYRRRGAALIVAAVVPGRGVVAFQMFYFREGERQRGIVHSAYTGVHPDFQGHGLGTRLRRFALDHFRRAGLKGASMLIATDNINSLKSSQKAGYQIESTSEDGATYTMITRFETDRS